MSDLPPNPPMRSMPRMEARRPVLRLDAVEFRLSLALLEQLVQLFADGGLHLLEVAAGLGGGYDVELPADLVRKDIRRDVRRDLVLVDEPLEQSRVLAQPEHVGDEVEGRHLLRAPLRNVPHHVDSRLRDAVLHGLAVRAAALGDPRLLLGDGLPRGDVPEVLLDFRFRRLRVDVAGDGDHGVRGVVVFLEPLLHVFERRGVEVVHRADRGPRVGVPGGIGILRQKLARHAVGLIFTPGASRFGRRRAARRVWPDRWRPAGGPCGPTPSTTRDRVRAWVHSGSSWCGRSWWCH